MHSRQCLCACAGTDIHHTALDVVMWGVRRSILAPWLGLLGMPWWRRMPTFTCQPTFIGATSHMRTAVDCNLHGLHRTLCT